MKKLHLQIVLLKTLKISWKIIRFILLFIAAIFEASDRKKYQPTQEEIAVGEKISNDTYYIPDTSSKNKA